MDILNETLLLLMPRRSEEQMERFFAEKAILKNPKILDNVLSFEKVVYAFNDLKSDFETFEPLPILCYAKACHQLGTIVPNWVANLEIKYYLAYLAFDEGWLEMPDQLKFANEQLKLLYPEKKLDAEQVKLQDLKHRAVRQYVNAV